MGCTICRMRWMSHFEANGIDGPEFEDPESGVTDSSAEAEADEEASPQQQGYIGGKGTGKGKRQRQDHHTLHSTVSSLCTSSGSVATTSGLRAS